MLPVYLPRSPTSRKPPSGEARPDAVQDELDGEGGEEHAEHAGEHVGPGLAKEAHYAGCEQEGEEREEEDEEEHGDKDPELRRAPLARVEKDRSYGARAGEQGDGEREDGDVLIVVLLLLAHRPRAEAGRACEDHVQREEEEEDAAGDAKGGDADAQRGEQHVTDEGEDQEYGGPEHGSPHRRLALAPWRVAAGERREDGGQPQGVNDHQQRHERVEYELRHGAYSTSQGGPDLRYKPPPLPYGARLLERALPDAARPPPAER